jgi:hypothetical protein
MTQHDLATLLREDVSVTEPADGLDPAVPMRLGRRGLRTRRLVSGVAVAAVLAVAGGVTVPLVSGEGAGPSRAVDPVSQRALESYDAARMPRLMDDHVRAVLDRTVPDLGPVTFRAVDGHDAALPPTLYDKASTLQVTYGSRAHQYSAEVAHFGGESESSAERGCAQDLAEGRWLECTVDTTPDGDVVVDRLAAVVPFGPDPEDGWKVVETGRLDTIDPGRLWFARTVEVIKSGTLVTYVHEQVKAPTPQVAEQEFRVPVEDLVEIGTDPVLVVPEPPEDDSGCGPWTLEVEQIRCDGH